MVTKVMAMLTWQTSCWPGCGESRLPRMESFEHFVGCPLVDGLADRDPANCGGHSNVMLPPHNPPLESQYNIKHGPDLTSHNIPGSCLGTPPTSMGTECQTLLLRWPPPKISCLGVALMLSLASTAYIC